MGYNRYLIRTTHTHSKKITTIMSDWKMSLFGCFGDMKLCLITFLFAPATIGQIAENTETDSFVCGMLKTFIPCYNIFYLKQLRDKVAAANGIEEEGCCSFLMKLVCCGECL